MYLYVNSATVRCLESPNIPILFIIAIKILRCSGVLSDQTDQSGLTSKTDFLSKLTLLLNFLLKSLLKIPPKNSTLNSSSKFLLTSVVV